MRLSVWAVSGGVLLALACGPEEPSAPSRPLSVEVASPAGEGSGEPFLSSDGDVVRMSWLQEAEEGGHDLWLSRLDPSAAVWSEPTHVAWSDRFFVNWADFPSVVADDQGRLWAHWLQRGDGQGYDYGVRISRSDDGGSSWSEPWTPHDDGTPTEHGFVSLFPEGNGVGAVWLDGRNYAAGPDGAPATREMTLRYRSTDGASPGPEGTVDDRVCDCCQTDVALTSSGPVVVYRNRTDDEVRDIYIARRSGDGWNEGRPVADDGWTIAGCPVNGPAVAADGERVVVAWFTGAGDEPRVNVAFSADAGDSFAPPIRVDDGTPVGRVDLLLDGSAAVVTWLEQVGETAGEIRARRVDPDGATSAAWTLAETGSSRAGGFPRLIAAPGGSFVLAWTDAASTGPSRVRTRNVNLPPVVPGDVP